MTAGGASTTFVHHAAREESEEEQPDDIQYCDNVCGSATLETEQGEQHEYEDGDAKIEECLDLILIIAEVIQ